MTPTARRFMAGVTLAVAGGFLVKQIVRTRRWFDFNNRVCIVTGGSRGLGLVLARHLRDAGAHVVIAARSEEDLQRASSELQNDHSRILAIPCDVTEQADVDRLVEQTAKAFGRIDVLFNVAGIIQVGPLDAMTMEDFEKAMETNCFGALRCALAVLPHMRQAGWGRIVNIASLGGKRAIPHMLPYDTSKFALVGLSTGLRAELLKENIIVTTICPSLMNTGSPRNATFKGQFEQEYAWFNFGDSMPGISMCADRAARQVMTACQYGDREVILHEPWNLGVKLQSLAPGLTQDGLELADRLLPAMGGIGKSSAFGREANTSPLYDWLTQRGTQAAIDNNQMRLQ